MKDLGASREEPYSLPTLDGERGTRQIAPRCGASKSLLQGRSDVPICVVGEKIESYFCAKSSTILDLLRARNDPDPVVWPARRLFKGG